MKVSILGESMGKKLCMVGESISVKSYKTPVYLGQTTASCLHLIFVCFLSFSCIISSVALSGKSVMLESCQ